MEKKVEIEIEKYGKCLDEILNLGKGDEVAPIEHRRRKSNDSATGNIEGESLLLRKAKDSDPHKKAKPPRGDILLTPSPHWRILRHRPHQEQTATVQPGGFDG